MNKSKMVPLKRLIFRLTSCGMCLRRVWSYIWRNRHKVLLRGREASHRESPEVGHGMPTPQEQSSCFAGWGIRPEGTGVWRFWGWGRWLGNNGWSTPSSYLAQEKQRPGDWGNLGIKGRTSNHRQGKANIEMKSRKKKEFKKIPDLPSSHKSPRG